MKTKLITKGLCLLLPCFALAACEVNIDSDVGSAESADEFVERVNAELRDLGTESGAVNWVRSTYIIHDTAILAAKASEKLSLIHI